MIYTKDKDVWVKNPADELTKIDGEYYAVICYVTTKNITAEPENMMYYCSLYIPEVHGKYKGSAQSYPVVEIPRCVDNDDPGYTPEIGDVCKVMFENGRSYTCRFIYMLHINDQNKLLNRNYLLYNILPTDIIDKPTNPEAYKALTWLLDYAYYITTGHTEDQLTAHDFVPCVLGSKATDKDSGWWIFNTEEGSAGKNWFCKALTMPFFSYFTSDFNAIGTPIEASDIYNVKNVIQDLYNNHFDELDIVDKFFKNSVYDFVNVDIKSPYEIYTSSTLEENKKENMFNFMLSCLALCNPRCAGMVVPGAGNLLEAFQPWNLSTAGISDYYASYAEYVWSIYNSNLLLRQGVTNATSHLAYSKFLLEFKTVYETEWLRSMTQFLSGINNIVNDNTNVKLKYTIILCLTICPWLAYPLLGYRQNLSQEALELIPKQIEYNNITWRTYSTYLSSDEEFTNVQTKLVNLARATDITPKNFVLGFRDVAYDVFGSGRLLLLYDESAGTEFVDTWDYYKMDEKFKRLNESLPSILEKIT